jgi:Zn finger protein HypA/HybF involved in hydrogenase expression
MSAERLGIAKGVKRQKFPQTIWLDNELMSWCLENAGKLGLATNAFVVEVLRKAKEYCEKGEWSPIQVKQEKVTVKEVKVQCPACFKEFDDTVAFEKHLKEDPWHVVERFKEFFGSTFSPNAVYTCPKCKIRFESEKEFLVHIRQELFDFVRYVKEETREK